MKLITLSFSHKALNYEADLLSVYEETSSVAEWFTLGLYLKLSPARLNIISADYRFSDEARQKMLSVWLQTGSATWSGLLRALSKMGLRSLGKEIANRKGW